MTTEQEDPRIKLHAAINAATAGSGCYVEEYYLDGQLEIRMDGAFTVPQITKIAHAATVFLHEVGAPKQKEIPT